MGEPVLTGPDRAQTSSLRLFLYCGLCPRPGWVKFPSSHSLPFLLQSKVLFSPPGQTHPFARSLAAHSPPQRPRHPAPQPRLVPLLETGSRKSKGFNSFSAAFRLSPTPRWPTPVDPGEAQLQGAETTNQQAPLPHPCNGTPPAPNSSISQRNLARDKARQVAR